MKYNFTLHHNEQPAMAMTRSYKHIRTMQPSYKPKSRVTATIQHKQATKPKIRIVKK